MRPRPADATVWSRLTPRWPTRPAAPAPSSARPELTGDRPARTLRRIWRRDQMHRRQFMAGCAGLPLTLTTAAFAEPGPLTRIVFPFAAGGGGDTFCRLLAEHLRLALDR